LRYVLLFGVGGTASSVYLPGNEKADEWAKLAAEKPDARGVDPLQRSLAHLKWEISEKKWAEARQWAGSRISKAKYKMPAKQKPDGVVAGSAKRHASKFYQLKTGHCLTGQYLNWTKSRPTPQCWWCASGTQTRDHLFKERSGGTSRGLSGRRSERKLGGGRAAGRSGICWPTRDAAGRY